MKENTRIVVKSSPTTAGVIIARVCHLYEPFGPLENADLKTGPYFQGVGKTAYEAIGHLVLNHGQSMGLEKLSNTATVKKLPFEEIGRQTLFPPAEDGVNGPCLFNVFIDTIECWARTPAVRIATCAK